MLEDGHVAARLPAQDLERAREFYAVKLGLHPVEERPGGLRYRGASGEFAVFESSGVASGTHTQMGWEVEDLDATVAELRRRGVAFEEYDLPGLRTMDGIATIEGNYGSKGGVGERGAWFRDSEGNLLAIGQRIGAPSPPGSVRRNPGPPLVLAVLPVWLVTAAWDFVCASALGVFAYHTTVARVWRGVASTVMGPAAIEGGAVAVAVGLGLHFAVALTWSTLFVVAVRRWPVLRDRIRTRAGALAVAAAYGPAIWLVMSLAVIPLATGRPPGFGVRWWVQVFAHVPFVTIPLVFTTRRVLGQRGAPSG